MLQNTTNPRRCESKGKQATFEQLHESDPIVSLVVEVLAIFDQ